MSFEFITYEKSDRIARITINRPKSLNALHPPASAELRQAFEDFRDDPEVWVAILTGSGDRSFCAGNDLKFQAEHGAKGLSYPGADTMPFGGITDNYTCWKPIIAAVNGYAIGGGLELVLACDLAIASDNTQFGAPEGKVGLVAAAGGVHRLPRQVPLKIAMGMLLAGRMLDAEEAHRYGLVNEGVPGDELAAAAERIASEIVSLAPLSARAHTQMALTGLGLPLDDAMASDYSENEKAMASDDFIEGPRAFAEKRKPIWTGE